MTDTLAQTLRTQFGFNDFLPGQRDVIERLLSGKSAATAFPTGGGKSLCYQLPALVLDGVTLVVPPLIALMKDQIDVLTARGIAAARLDSTLSADTYRDCMQLAAQRSLAVAVHRQNDSRTSGFAKPSGSFGWHCSQKFAEAAEGVQVIRKRRSGVGTRLLCCVKWQRDRRGDPRIHPPARGHRARRWRRQFSHYQIVSEGLQSAATIFRQPTGFSR